MVSPVSQLHEMITKRRSSILEQIGLFLRMCDPYIYQPPQIMRKQKIVTRIGGKFTFQLNTTRVEDFLRSKLVKFGLKTPRNLYTLIPSYIKEKYFYKQCNASIWFFLMNARTLGLTFTVLHLPVLSASFCRAITGPREKICYLPHKLAGALQLAGALSQRCTS